MCHRQDSSLILQLVMPDSHWSRSSWAASLFSPVDVELHSTSPRKVSGRWSVGFSRRARFHSAGSRRRSTRCSRMRSSSQTNSRSTTPSETRSGEAHPREVTCSDEVRVASRYGNEVMGENFYTRKN